MQIGYNGPYPSNEEIVRNKLMDAAIVCLQDSGINKTTIRGIAEQSGIARQTVYNYYKNKGEILSAALEREGVKLAAAMAADIRQYPDAKEKFIRGFIYIVENFPRNPILAQIIEPGNTFYGAVGMSHYSFATFGMLAFSEVFQEHPELAKDGEEISELWIRNVMSFLSMPGPQKKSRDELEGFIRRRLLPGLGLK